MRQPRLCGLVWLSLLTLNGCTVPDYLCLAPSAPASLSLESTRETNRRTALAVDLVYVRSPGLADEIGKLEARQYFAGRDQLLLDHPGSVETRLWELAPGQSVLATETDPPCGVEGTFLFADFAAPGAHRLRLDDRQQVNVTLGTDTLELSE